MAIDDGLATLQLELNAGARAAIDVHARLLRAWNAQINLTALRQPKQVAVGHVLDSLSALPLLRRLPTHASLLDIGSGGGFPGVPLAAALPAVRCALVDSVAKKARFLTVAAAAVTTAMITAGQPAPSFQVLAQRAEDLAGDDRHRQQWGCVVARAVGSLAEVIELGLPLLQVGGRLIAWKSDSSDGSLQRELDASRGILRITGGRVQEVVPMAANLDAALGDHVLVVVHKERSTPNGFPRPPAERRRALLT